MKRVGKITRQPYVQVLFDGPDFGTTLVEGTRVYVAETRGVVNTSKSKRGPFVVRLRRGSMFEDQVWEFRDRRDARIRFNTLISVFGDQCQSSNNDTRYFVDATEFFSPKAKAIAKDIRDLFAAISCLDKIESDQLYGSIAAQREYRACKTQLINDAKELGR